MTVSIQGSLRVSGALLTGWAVSHRRMLAEAGVFSAAGQTARLSVEFVYALPAAQGAVVFAGQAAGLSRTGARAMAAAQGVITVTRRPAVLSRARKMPAAHGTRTVTGQAVTLTHTLTGAFPNAFNTGHTGTLTLSSGDLASSSNGQIIQNLNITGLLTINHTGVTVRNCQAQLMYLGPSVGSPATNCIVEDCTIVGGGLLEQTGIVIGYAPTTIVRRNDISGVEEGVYVAFGGTVRDNWIHNLASPGDPIPEINGITCQGGESGILIEHNTVDISSSSQAAVFISSDYAAIANITVNNNKLLGGGYCIISQVTAYPVSGIAVTSNRMDNWGVAPGFVIDNAVLWTGNVDDSSSVTLPGPPINLTTGVTATTGQGVGLTYSAAGLSEWPDASSTGVPAGTTLTRIATFASSANGEIIDAIDADQIFVSHLNVTVKRCFFNMLWLGSDAGINYHVGNKASGAIVEDCTIVGQLGLGFGDYGIRIWDFSDFVTIRRCNFSIVENGILMHGADCEIYDNYFHDMNPGVWPGGHCDCIQVHGTIEIGGVGGFPRRVDRPNVYHNNMDVPGANSCMTLSNFVETDTGVMDGVFENNRFNGGLYTITMSAGHNNLFQNNQFISYTFGWFDPGYWAPTDEYSEEQNQTYINNTFGGVLYPTGFPYT